MSYSKKDIQIISKYILKGDDLGLIVSRNLELAIKWNVHITRFQLRRIGADSVWYTAMKLLHGKKIAEKELTKLIRSVDNDR